MEKVEVYVANEESRLEISSNDLGHAFGGDVRNDLGKLMRGKGSHETIFAYDIVRIQSILVFTDILENNIIGDTKAPLLRCFPFISKLKSGDVISTAQYMNYQTFSNLQFGRFLKKNFHIKHNDLRDTSCEKISLFRWKYLKFLSCLEKFPKFICIRISV